MLDLVVTQSKVLRAMRLHLASFLCLFSTRASRSMSLKVVVVVVVGVVVVGFVFVFVDVGVGV